MVGDLLLPVWLEEARDVEVKEEDSEEKARLSGKDKADEPKESSVKDKDEGAKESHIHREIDQA